MLKQAKRFHQALIEHFSLGKAAGAVDHIGRRCLYFCVHGPTLDQGSGPRQRALEIVDCHQGTQTRNAALAVGRQALVSAFKTARNGFWVLHRPRNRKSARVDFGIRVLVLGQSIDDWPS